MPDAESPPPESPDSTATAPTAPAPESTGTSESRSLGTLQDAFRADPHGLMLKGNGPRASADAPPSDPDSPEESAAGPSITSDAGSAALKPGEVGVSRRGAAAAIKDRDAEIERLVAERRAADARADEQQRRLAEVDRAQGEARKAALDLIGDDREFARLQDARLRNRTLSYEEDERLDRMIQWREYAQTFWELADRGHKAGMARSLGDRAERYGLDKQQAFGSDLPALVDHAVTVTEARVRAEQSERIKELEAELVGLRTRAAANGRSAPTVGGSSAGSGSAGRMPADGASAEEWFRFGIQERATRPGNGAAHSRR